MNDNYLQYKSLRQYAGIALVCGASLFGSGCQTLREVSEGVVNFPRDILEQTIGVHSSHLWKRTTFERIRPCTYQIETPENISGEDSTSSYSESTLRK